MKPEITSEAILFFARNRVSNEMTYDEFEAVLDGVVALPDLAGLSMPAAYVRVNDRLKVLAMVLFLLEFDRQGYADKSWNIPLRHLADTGKKGPDLGAGSIALVCKSQCALDWLKNRLWDPILTSGQNSFALMERAILANRLCLPTLDCENKPATADANSLTALYDSQIPAAAEDQGMTTQQLAALEAVHRQQLAGLIREQRLHLSSLQTQQEQQLARLKRDYEKRLQQRHHELQQLTQKKQLVSAQKQALREQNAALRSQLETLQTHLDREMLTAASKERRQLETLRAEYESLLEQRMQQEMAQLQEQIEQRNMELLAEIESGKALREEVCELRRDKLRLVNEGGDKFLERLETLGVNFIAFHPGAGHISIPLKEMGVYMENPIAYAADRCLVSESHYLAWLQHYQQPVCQAPLGDKQPCGEKIPRIDVPSQFVPGEHDRCERHSKDVNTDNVVKLLG